MNEKKTENTRQKNILLSLCKGNDAKGNDDDDDDDDDDDADDDDDDELFLWYGRPTKSV